jgi:hypothetical protein
MDDPILKLRLDMLNENLQTALRMTSYLSADLDALGIDTEALKQAFEHHTGLQQKLLDRARETLGRIDATNRDEVRTAWDEYAKLSELNGQIYREFLEAMLGLAIRRNAIDDKFCKVADALIHNMKSFLVRGDALAIPASQEAYSRTLARLVRMRFPEWSIWSMPLVAHEFGHVVIEDVDDLEAFAKNEAATLAVKDPGYLPAPKDEPEKRKNRAIEQRMYNRVRQLIADAFAVYTIGPSYACSLIFLRLRPVSPDSAEGYARDAERATVAIEMLRMMAAAVPPPMNYTDIMQELEQVWAGMLDRSGGEPLMAADRGVLLKLVGRIKTVLEDLLVNAGYRNSIPGGAGWSKAYQWYSLWAEKGKQTPNNLPVPEDITASSKVYDALNAAWAYRLFSKPQNLEPVAKATLGICNAIIDFRGTSRAGGGKSAGQG